MESFGEQLRALREERKLTVNQLATYSGVSAAGISRIENGKRGVPKPATIKKLAEALKIPYEGLMYKAGYIEEVHEARAPYETKCKLLEKAEAYDLKNLALLENEKRDVIPETPVRIEYSLTDKGKALAPILGEISKWATEWIDPSFLD
ncbi:helix-turn-helix domain-containing protein [Bacillus subtilis]|uniref:helix-turn-helix domain-containing protein n=1 Tax=Bacillus subtilis TaxID=1423 RepID=UPI003F85E7F2